MSINEIIADAPQAIWTFALAVFSGLVVLIARFARLGSKAGGVERNLVGLRDDVREEFAEMRAEIAEVGKNLSRLGERVAKTEGRVDGRFEASNPRDDVKPENDEWSGLRAERIPKRRSNLPGRDARGGPSSCANVRIYRFSSGRGPILIDPF